MVIMDNYYVHDRLTELCSRIDKVHLKYLDVEESPQKIEIRTNLEDLIREYLCLASHNQKFSLPITYEVLYRSANSKPNFSGYKSATGFNALQLYAGNLVSQPWRKEYKQIRKYSGFYKHHLESNLVNAELLLEAMGYKPIGLSTLILDGPIGPDKVITVSKDCLIAYVECQIIKVIWEEMASANMNVSWLEILDFRQTHLCSPEQSIKALKYQYQQKHFQHHILSSSQGNLDLHHVPSSYSNHSFPPMASHDPAIPQYLYGNGCCQTAHAQMGSSYQFSPIMSYQPHNIIKPQFNANGYYYANGLTPQVSNYSHSVPIAKLIEVESQNGYDVVDRPSHSRSTFRTHNSTGDMYANYNGGDLMGRDNRDSSKTDSPFEDWDYVYKTLENQGYNKDLGERGDVLSLGLDGKPRQDPKNIDKKKKEIKKPKVTNLEVSVNNLTLPSKSKQIQADRTAKSRKLSDSKSQKDDSPSSSYDNLTPNDKKQSNKNSNLTLFKTKTVNTDKGVTSKPSPKIAKKDEKVKQKESKPDCSWHCKTCTFLNQHSKNICEMCSRSKSNVEDDIQVGGAECEQCTLVNPKDAKNCQACEQSLENSPTRV